MPAPSGFHRFGIAAFIASYLVRSVVGADELHARLGTYSGPLAPAELKAYGVSEPGAVIVGVFSGTPADQAGLKAGDVLLEFDGKPVASDKDMIGELKKHSPGDEVALAYSRRGEHSRITVRLAPPSENFAAEVFKMAESGAPWAEYDVAEMYAAGKQTKQDYVKARYWFNKAAEAGFANAQRRFGQMCESGAGADVDLKQARDWYEKAAIQGDAVAQRFLGVMYITGRGCERDPAAAIRWYKESAAHGDAWAQNNLGELSQAGIGTAKDSRVAAEWFEKAAKSGNTEAMATLGLMYIEADGVSQNYEAALRWLKPAAQAGVARAQHSLGYLYEYGKGVPRDLAAAAQWFHAAGDRGYLASQTALAVMYYYDSAPPDYQKAFEWANKAAQQNDPRALNLLGIMYNDGHGTPADPGKAFEYYRQAAQSGDPVFRANLGYCYSRGTGVKPDFAEAVRLIQPLADNGVPNDALAQCNAQNELGELYYTGDEHLPKNPNVAMLWFEKAAQAGHLHSQVVLGMMLAERKRYKDAAKWYRAAAEKGDSLAENNLGILYANGWGVPKSRKDAIAWLLRAYQQGYTNAAPNLRKLGVDAK